MLDMFLGLWYIFCKQSDVKACSLSTQRQRRRLSFLCGLMLLALQPPCKQCTLLFQMQTYIEARTGYFQRILLFVWERVGVSKYARVRVCVRPRLHVCKYMCECV